MPSAPAVLLFACGFGLAGAAGATPAATAPFMPRAAAPAPPQTFYFVLTDRFANGTPDNDRGGLAGDRNIHGFDPTAISHYHGGDFVGLSQHLDYLKQLGVTALWVTPPFKNKPVQSGTAGYHGYWIVDFLQIDPHLGTDAEFREFVAGAHARGMRVFLDIIVNHTADVISPAGATGYRSEAEFPWRDAAGRVFDEQAVSYNRLGPADAFPPLSLETSFARPPRVTAEEARVKHPAWLNDLTLYHNRGNTTFSGEDSLHGDFIGLDDLFTEHPRVVEGLIDVFSHWIREYGIDGFRLDTARHVNPGFWEAFCPAMHDAARAVGREDFLLFGEVFNQTGDARMISEYSTVVPIDTTLDFGFFAAARDYLSRGAPADRIGRLFEDDDFYTDHDSHAHVMPTFLGNHDAGRFGYFLLADTPSLTEPVLLKSMILAHALLFLSRGQPVIYYGDEQGMTGSGGDMAARDDMFATQAELYRDHPLIGTERTGADDKFDPAHPLFRAIREFASLRAQHPALSQGAQRVRATENSNVFAFSRWDRGERREYLAAFNNSRDSGQTVALRTSQPEGARFSSLPLSTAAPASTLEAGRDGLVRFRLEPLQFAVWRAEQPLPPAPSPPRVQLLRPREGEHLPFSTVETDGQRFPTRTLFEAAVHGGDGVAEVTFLLQRASRKHQYELLGVDDAAPYRLFWRPPADLADDETLTVIAVANDLRGQRSEARSAGVSLAAPGVDFGITGSTVPRILQSPPAELKLGRDETLNLTLAAEARPAPTYQWFRDGEPIAGATDAALRLVNPPPGLYVARVRNLAGTTLTAGTRVERQDP